MKIKVSYGVFTPFVLGSMIEQVYLFVTISLGFDMLTVPSIKTFLNTSNTLRNYAELLNLTFTVEELYSE